MTNMTFWISLKIVLKRVEKDEIFSSSSLNIFSDTIYAAEGEIARETGNCSFCKAQIFILQSYPFHVLRRRRELLTTETELRAMAAAANSGFRRMPKNGYSAPAATGIPRML